MNPNPPRDPRAPDAGEDRPTAPGPQPGPSATPYPGPPREPSEPPVDTHDPDAGAPRGRTRFISRLRSLANLFLLVFGLLFLLGFLVVIGGTPVMRVETLRWITTAVSYVGFIAGVAFVLSVVTIIIENRTGGDDAPGEGGP